MCGKTRRTDGGRTRTDSRYRSYPACPDCDTDVFVSGFTGAIDYECHACGARFDEPDLVSGGPSGVNDDGV